MQPREQEPEPFEVPGWVGPVATGICAVVGLAALALLASLLLRALRGRDKPRLFVEEDEPVALTPPPPDEVIAAVDAGLMQLSDLDADPRRAVIACWVRLEAAAAAAGTPREIGDSPTDLVTRLLSAHQVSRSVLDGLARVYREARYATHPVDDHARRAAVAALQHLRAELAAPGLRAPSEPGGAYGQG